MTLNELAAQLHEDMLAKGFWKQGADPARALMLIVSELSEALEELRMGREVNDYYYGPGVDLDGNPIAKPMGVPSELADTLIRTLETCHAWGIDIDTVVQEKAQFNRIRGPRGIKRF